MGDLWTEVHKKPGLISLGKEGKMFDLLVMLSLALVTGTVAFAVGRSGRKPALAPVVQPKIFGLSEFERFVRAIPELAKANPNTLNVVVNAGTGLAVGLLGFEDRVVPETEEAMGKKATVIRLNDEKVARLQEEISDIQSDIAETNRESAGAQARIDMLSELKKLKTS